MQKGRGAFLAPSLMHGGTQRIDEARSILTKFEREQEDLQERKLRAQQLLVETVRDELEDSVASLQRRHAVMLEHVRRCSVAVNHFNHAAYDRLQLCLADIQAMRVALDRAEEQMRTALTECLDSRLSLLDEQMRLYAIATPETEELIRHVQNFLDQADSSNLITNTRPLIEEIQKQSERISKLPSPADEEPFSHISFRNVTTARHSVSALEVDLDKPVIYYVVPCTGNVSGGTTVRIEGSHLAGDDVKVFVGGILCDHVAIRSPQGGSSITLLTPPCQGDLNVEIIVEVDGFQATGGPSFQYFTPAPRVQAADVTLYHTDTGHVQVPIRGEGFSRIANLNVVEFRAQDEAGNERGDLLPHDIAEVDEQCILCLIPQGEVPPGYRILASVCIAGVSSGRPVVVGQVGNNETRQIFSSMRARGTPDKWQLANEYLLQSQYRVSSPRASRKDDPQKRQSLHTTGSKKTYSVSSQNKGSAPSMVSNDLPPWASRVLKADLDFLPDIGRRQHCAFYVERGGFAWGAFGVACQEVNRPESPQWYSSQIRGWVYHSDGRCTNFLSAERVDTGVAWGENCTIGVTACYESGTVTFYKDNSVVHIFGQLREPCRTFIGMCL